MSMERVVGVSENRTDFFEINKLKLPRVNDVVHPPLIHAYVRADYKLKFLYLIKL